MGLAERRVIATIKSEQVPKYQQQMNEAVGFDMPFDIDTGTLPEDKTVLDCWAYYHESYGPGMVVQVMKDICADDLGKEAVKEKFDKIVFQNTAKSAEDPGDKSVEITDKTLIVRESFYGYSDKLYGADDLRTTIEAML